VRKDTATMGQVVQTDFVTKFPVINFKKKRLSVVIHAQFDMECESDVSKITYTVSDI
jgi:hypothetical protein